MSTLVYGRLTSVREASPPGTTTEENKPGVRTFVDALAGLVPAEVLVAHAVILTAATKRSDDGMVTTITDTATLQWSFWLLVVVSVFLYLLGRAHRLERWDGVRMFIPPLAFVGWTMLQKATAFDAVWPDLSESARTAIAVIGAIVLGAIASALAQKADETPVPTI